MRKAVLSAAALAVLALACRPDFICSDLETRLSRPQKAALAGVDSAFAACRAALRAGRDLDGRTCFDGLSARAEDFLAAQGELSAAEAESVLARRIAGLVSEAASDFPASGERREAAEAALKGYREHLLKKHPRAGKYLK